MSVEHRPPLSAVSSPALPSSAVLARTRVKICGLTRAEDVHAAVAAGADAVGLVFYPPSPRAVTLDQAARLRHLVPPFVSVVALFVNPSAAEVRAVINAVAPDLLQFHGDESPADCAAFGLRYLKALRVGASGLQTAAQIAASCTSYADASGWLFDAHHAGYGGSGVRFDLDLLDEVLRLQPARPVILAGGLNADNVSDAIARVRPYAVDVSSGVEDAPGVKSAEKIGQFVRAVGLVTVEKRNIVDVLSMPGLADIDLDPPRLHSLTNLPSTSPAESNH